MNRSLLLFITSLFSVSLSAQYSIDLSKIQYPSIEYLKWEILDRPVKR